MSEDTTKSRGTGQDRARTGTRSGTARREPALLTSALIVLGGARPPAPHQGAPPSLTSYLCISFPQLPVLRLAFCPQHTRLIYPPASRNRIHVQRHPRVTEPEENHGLRQHAQRLLPQVRRGLRRLDQELLVLRRGTSCPPPARSPSSQAHIGHRRVWVPQLHPLCLSTILSIGLHIPPNLRIAPRPRRSQS